MLFIIVIIYFISCIHPTFALDESFSFGLIQYHIGRLISLDSMDVHPPLYYILLKIFLIITTFWTKNIIIKILFARVFSFITLIIFCFFGIKILSLCGVYNKLNNYILIFLLMPPTIMSSLKIRMYSLSAVFVLLTLYYLLKFNYNNKVKYLVCSIIFAILSSYTFYFAGLSAGLLFVIFGFDYLWHKKFKSFYRMILLGNVLLLFFIPWLPIALKQMSYHSNSDNGHNNILIQSLGALSQSNVGGIRTIICFFIDLLIFFLIIYSFKKINKNRFKDILSILLIDGVFTLIISILLCGRNFQTDVLYPIFMIISLLLSVLISYGFNKRHLYIISYLLVGLLIISSFGHIYKHVKDYDLPSINLINNYEKWDKYNGKNILLNTNKFPLSKPMTISEDAIYLKSINKNILLKNYNYNKLSAGLLNNNNNSKLIKNTFVNIKIKNK